MEHRFARSLALALAALMMSACSAPPQGAPLLPVSESPQLISQQNKTAEMQFTIRWPAAKHAASAHRKPVFLSPSAQSLRIDAAPADSDNLGQTVTRIVNKPGPAGGTKTIRLRAPVGKDVVTFIAFDRIDAEGNQLGGTTLHRTIVANRVNLVHATLEGYAAGFSITSTDSRFAPSGVDANGAPIFTVAGEAKLTIFVDALDVDGNVILAPGAPAIKARSDNTSFAVASVRGRANQFTVQATAPLPNGPGSRAQIVFSAAGADGTTYSSACRLFERGLFYASAGSGVSARIYAYDTLGKRYLLPGTFSGLRIPVGLAHDDTNHRIYVADAGASAVLAFDENGDAVAGWKPPAVPGITGVTFSAHVQNVIASSAANNGEVLAFDTTGARVNAGGFGGLHAPALGIAYGCNHFIGVVERGYPGYFNAFTDTGTPLPQFSLTPLYDLDTYLGLGSYPFSPTGIGAAAVLGGCGPGNTMDYFWISGQDTSADHSSRFDEVTLYVPFYSGAGSSIRPVIAGDPNNAALFPNSGYVTTDITHPLSAALNPATNDFYVVNGSGGLTGFSCGTIVCYQTSSYPQYLGTYPIPGEAPTILPPAGVSHFTAATFTEY